MKSTAINKELSKKKKHLLETFGRCFFCGKPHGKVDLTLVHLIRRSYSVNLILDDRNLTLGCLSCHTAYDDGFGSKSRNLGNIELAIARVREMDEFYANRIEDRLSRPD